MKSGSSFAFLGLLAVAVGALFFFARTPASDTGAGGPVIDLEAQGMGGEGEPSTRLADIELESRPGADGRLRDLAAPADGVSEGERAGSLRVLAVDAVTGRPVKRFWIKPDGVLDLASEARPVLSDPENGGAMLNHTVWESEEQAFLISSPRHTPASELLSRPRRAGMEQTLRLQRAASIVGTVRDGSSAPLASARVTLYYFGTALDSASDLGPGGSGDLEAATPMPDTYQGPTLRLTDAAGEYAFSQLPPGVYRTSVEQASTRHNSDPIFVRPGDWSLGDHWLDEHVRLTVTVLKADGTAAPKTRLSLVEAAPPLNASLGENIEIAAQRYTDLDGRATFGPLGPGEYAVYTQSDDGVAAPKACAVMETSRSLLELSVQLEPR